MKSIAIASIQDPVLRRAAKEIDRSTVDGSDGWLTTDEVAQSLATALDPSSAASIALRGAMIRLGEYVELYGTDTDIAPAVARTPTSPLIDEPRIHLAELPNNQPAVVLSGGEWSHGIDHVFEVPFDDRRLASRRSMVVPLEAREVFYFEVTYQDVRKLSDLEFSYSRPNQPGWVSFRGDDLFSMMNRETQGEVNIRRDLETSHPSVTNPVRVKVEILYPDGNSYVVGTREIDFKVNDAYNADSSGYEEVAIFDNEMDRLPSGRLPPGCLLLLTPWIDNRRPWETEDVAAEVTCVKIEYMP